MKPHLFQPMIVIMLFWLCALPALAQTEATPSDSEKAVSSAVQELNKNTDLIAEKKQQIAELESKINELKIKILR